MVETRSDTEARHKVLEMIKDIEVTMMVTVDANGHMRGRPMRAQSAGATGDALWFFTRDHTPKVAEAHGDGRVLLAYSDPKAQNYVAIFGHAAVVHDRAKVDELWSEGLRVWFPKGKDDPEIALLKVSIEGAEYWDSPSSTMLHAYGYVKAVITGASPSSGENAKVSFT